MDKEAVGMGSDVVSTHLYTAVHAALKRIEAVLAKHGCPQGAEMADWLDAALAQQPAAQAAGLTECLNAHMSRFGPEPAGISAQRESDFVAGWNAAIARAASSGELRQKLHHFLNAAAGEGLQMDGVDADDLYIALFPAEYARAVASLDGDSAPQPSAQQAEPMIHYGGGLAGNVSFEQPAEEALGPFNTADEAIAALRVEEARGVDGGLMEAIRRYAFLFALHTQNNTDASRAEADAALARIRSLLAAPAAGTGECDATLVVPAPSRLRAIAGSGDVVAMSNALIHAANALAAPQAATGAQGLAWTSVNDRLPPLGTGERVLIYTEGADFAGEQFFDIKADDLYPDPDGEQDARTEVAAAATHWMPLPLPGLAILAQAAPSAGAVTEETALETALKIMANLEDRNGVLDGVDDDTKADIADEIALAILAASRKGEA